jgi:hypothetical protein
MSFHIGESIKNPLKKGERHKNERMLLNKWNFVIRFIFLGWRAISAFVYFADLPFRSFRKQKLRNKQKETSNGIAKINRRSSGT